jgi:hypothetical protein
LKKDWVACTSIESLETKMKRRHLLALSLNVLMGLTVSLVPSVWAQSPVADWPKQTVKFVVPFTAGSGTDIVARAVAERLSSALAQAAPSRPTKSPSPTLMATPCWSILQAMWSILPFTPTCLMTR